MTICGLIFSTLFSFAAVALFISAAAGSWVTGTYEVQQVTVTRNVFLLYTQQLSKGFSAFAEYPRMAPLLFL